MTTTTTTRPDGLTCPECIRRLESLAGGRASDRYDVGSPARNQMGHEMFHSRTGRTALCIAAPAK